MIAKFLLQPSYFVKKKVAFRSSVAFVIGICLLNTLTIILIAFFAMLIDSIDSLTQVINLYYESILEALDNRYNKTGILIILCLAGPFLEEATFRLTLNPTRINVATYPY